MKQIYVKQEEEERNVICYLCNEKIKGKPRHLVYYGYLKEICKFCHSDIMGRYYFF